MRVVLDTNILISGLLWSGAPERIIKLGTLGQVDLYSSTVMMQEFEQVSSYARLQKRMRELEVAQEDMLAVAYAILHLVEAPAIDAVIPADPDDDMLLACALVAQAHYIISGDHHLLDLGEWRGIQIVTVNDFLAKHFPEETDT